MDSFQVQGSVNAGVGRISETPFMDNRFDTVMMGHLPEEVLSTLEPEIVEQGLASLEMRLLRLLTPALLEAIGERNIQPPPVFIALPEPGPEKVRLDGENFLKRLKQQTGADLDLKQSKAYSMGRAGIFYALEDTYKMFATGRGPKWAIVGGVDSYFDCRRVSRLIGENRHRCPENLDAMIPGEGAAFLLLTSERNRSSEKISSLAGIEAVAVGEEQGHRYSDEPYLGEGLAGVFTDLFQQVSGDEIKTVFAGFTGENIFAKEWGVSFMRNRKRFSETLQLEHSAEYMGDAGAALAPIMMAVIARGMSNDQLKGPSIVFSSSDGALRGAACLVL
jgi:3-oxoacyl-[acyl-carrier-protein] synthase-1